MLAYLLEQIKIDICIKTLVTKDWPYSLGYLFCGYVFNSAGMGSVVEVGGFVAKVWKVVLLVMRYEI